MSKLKKLPVNCLILQRNVVHEKKISNEKLFCFRSFQCVGEVDLRSSKSEMIRWRCWTPPQCWWRNLSPQWEFCFIKKIINDFDEPNVVNEFIFDKCAEGTKTRVLIQNFWSSIKFRVKQINSRTTKSLPDLFIPHDFEFFERLIDQERLELNLFIYKNH